MKYSILNIFWFLSLFQIIYTARNAKDTCISYFHHCQLLEGYKGSFDEFAQLFITDSRELYFIHLHYIFLIDNM